jgi:hypothetical protein
LEISGTVGIDHPPLYGGCTELDQHRGTLDVRGLKQSLFDINKFTDAGEIHLLADAGGISLEESGVLNLAANKQGGGAGLLQVAAPYGLFDVKGRISAFSMVGERGGSFVQDISTMPSLAGLQGILKEAGFSESQDIRAARWRCCDRLGYCSSLVLTLGRCWKYRC